MAFGSAPAPSSVTRGGASFGRGQHLPREGLRVRLRPRRWTVRLPRAIRTGVQARSLSGRTFKLRVRITATGEGR
jgi:hypothetical protein